MQLHSVVWLPRQHLSLEHSDFLGQLRFNSLDLLLFSFAPDQVQVLQQLIDELRRQVIAVFSAESVGKLESFLWHHIIT